MRRIVWVVGIASVLASASCASPLAWQAQTPVTVPLIGVYEQGVPNSYELIRSFTLATGVQPRIVLYYSAWYEKFSTSFARTAASNDAVPFVELEPWNVSLRAITAGRYDNYLRAYAASVRSFGHPVILSFAHEMNGDWYPWGEGHVDPSTFVNAWRHVVDIFRAQGASNVAWLWTVSSVNLTSSPLLEWWPGSRWVDDVGIDGYYYRASDTFSSVFGTTIAQVRKFGHDPILISETAVGPAAGPTKIAGIFAGIRTDHLLGLVWFDKAQDDPPIHQDWRLENTPAALSAFRLAAKRAGA